MRSYIGWREEQWPRRKNKWSVRSHITSIGKRNNDLKNGELWDLTWVEGETMTEKKERPMKTIFPGKRNNGLKKGELWDLTLVGERNNDLEKRKIKEDNIR